MNTQVEVNAEISRISRNLQDKHARELAEMRARHTEERELLGNAQADERKLLLVSIQGLWETYRKANEKTPEQKAEHVAAYNDALKAKTADDRERVRVQKLVDRIAIRGGYDASTLDDLVLQIEARIEANYAVSSVDGLSKEQQNAVIKLRQQLRTLGALPKVYKPGESVKVSSVDSEHGRPGSPAGAGADLSAEEIEATLNAALGAPKRNPHES